MTKGYKIPGPERQTTVTERTSGQYLASAPRSPVPTGQCEKAGGYLHMQGPHPRRRTLMLGGRARMACQDIYPSRLLRKNTRHPGMKANVSAMGEGGHYNYYPGMFLEKYAFKFLWMNLWLPRLFAIQTCFYWEGPSYAVTWKTHGELFPNSYLLVNWGKIIYHVEFSSDLFLSVFSTGSIEALEKTLVDRINKHAWFWGPGGRCNWLSHEMTLDTFPKMRHEIDTLAFLSCLCFLTQVFRTLPRKKGASSWRIPKRLYQLLVWFYVTVHIVAPSYRGN